jgi:hypothetical protein
LGQYIPASKRQWFQAYKDFLLSRDLTSVV